MDLLCKAHGDRKGILTSPFTAHSGPVLVQERDVSSCSSVFPATQFILFSNCRLLPFLGVISLTFEIFNILDRD